MAKNFPFFKFVATEWLTGDIVFEDLNIQGLFINICALYWQRDGELSIDEINKRYKNPVELPKLSDRFLNVENGFISIKFLDEQLISVGHISAVNSQNGKLGGRPKALLPKEKKPTAKRTKANESDGKQIRTREEIEKEFIGRELKFATTLKPFVETYGKEMIREFYDHWREPNKSKSKMKFEIKETWDINLRLKTWERNLHKFGDRGKQKEDTPVYTPSKRIIDKPETADEVDARLKKEMENGK